VSSHRNQAWKERNEMKSMDIICRRRSPIDHPLLNGASDFSPVPIVLERNSAVCLKNTLFSGQRLAMRKGCPL